MISKYNVADLFKDIFPKLLDIDRQPCEISEYHLNFVSYPLSICKELQFLVGSGNLIGLSFGIRIYSPTSKLNLYN